MEIVINMRGVGMLYLTKVVVRMRCNLWNTQALVWATNNNFCSFSFKFVTVKHKHKGCRECVVCLFHSLYRYTHTHTQLTFDPCFQKSFIVSCPLKFKRITSAALYNNRFGSNRWIGRHMSVFHDITLTSQGFSTTAAPIASSIGIYVAFCSNPNLSVIE